MNVMIVIFSHMKVCFHSRYEFIREYVLEALLATRIIQLCYHQDTRSMYCITA
jgi:hypothetical protein